MKHFLPIIFLLIFNSAFAQEGLRIIMDTKPVGSVIRLSKYVGDMTVPLDSLRYRGEAEINFKYDSRFTDGVYVVDIGELESFQLIIVNQENMVAHIYESGAGMAFKPDQSKENDAFNIMMNLSDVYSSSMDTLNTATKFLSDFDPRHATVMDSLELVYHRIADAYNNSLGLLENLFPESYSAQVLVPLDKIPLRSQKPEWRAMFDNDPAFNHVHYFAYINFNDERIITNPYLSNKVLDYLYNYTERSEQGVKESIDKILSMPNMHPKVQSFLIDLLVDFFADKEAAEFIDHINRNYLGSCDLPLSEETLKKINSSVKFKSGDQLPQIKIPNQTNHQVPIHGLTGDLNVVVFWASWCPHCMREIPKLQELYNEMQGKLGVYAISLDTNKTDWINAINGMNLRWLNVNDLKGWQSETLTQFGVTSSPTLFLVDDKLRFLGRASSFDGLSELVRTQLAE
ncbi:MAG: TlpA family protein disulfide reductase [Flavobacteriales bacterium]|nr:TlpA family protein disulfide reductase [Flavobacteriales bacterium]MCB9191353.1 TlpA family protein disulfide reductase [Flavobacteriales bacterium]MCB9204021.1 TlpA family protein disulfide reductase [Flavobacteriales bacterium]